MTRDLTTPENRAFWRAIDKAAKALRAAKWQVGAVWGRP